MVQNLKIAESIYSQSFSSDTFQENLSEIKQKGEVIHLYRDTVDEKKKRE